MSLLKQETKAYMLRAGTFLCNRKLKLIALSVWGVILISYVILIITMKQAPLDLLLYLVNTLRTNTFGSILYLLIYLVRPIVFFPVGLLMIAGGFLFGPLKGILYAVIGCNLSAAISFMLGRYFGARIQSRNNKFFYYISYLSRNDFETVLLLRFILLPFDFVNYLSSFLRIEFFSFLTATMLGSLPWIVSYTLFGSSLNSVEFLLNGNQYPLFDWRALTISLSIFCMSFFFSFLLRRKSKDNDDTKSIIKN